MTERFICAIRTLYVMLIHERWYEAKQIVSLEIDWLSDPEPPGLEKYMRKLAAPLGYNFYSTWPAVLSVLEKKCNAR